jgi:hypothetical protein
MSLLSFFGSDGERRFSIIESIVSRDERELPCLKYAVEKGSPADVQAVLDWSKRETSTLPLSIEKFKSIVTSVDANKLRVILKFFSHQYI